MEAPVQEEIELLQPTRLYRKVEGTDRLVYQGRLLPEGRVMRLGNELIVYFDHTNHRAVECLDKEGVPRGYLFLKDIKTPELAPS